MTIDFSKYDEHFKTIVEIYPSLYILSYTLYVAINK